MQVVVGRLGRPHGVHGEFNVEVLTDDPQKRFSKGSTFTLEKSKKLLTVASVRFGNKKLYVRFEEVGDRTEAEKYKGDYLQLILQESEVPKSGNEFYDQQLIGLIAKDVNKNELGKVVEVVHAPLQDLLVVKALNNKEVLVPFVDQIVPQVEITEGWILITPPAGLFDDGAIEAR